MVPMIAKAERKSLLQACGRLTMSLVFMVGLTGFTLVLATPASAADQEFGRFSEIRRGCGFCG